jgi:signal transduction histidine kinase
MRRQLTLLVAATTSVVLLAFLLPTAVLLSRLAESSALNDAQVRSQSLVPLVATEEPVEVGQFAATVDGMEAAGYPVAVFLPDGSVVGVGEAAQRDPAVRVAAASRTARIDDYTPAAGGPSGKRLLQPVTRPDGTAVIRVLIPHERLVRGVHQAWLVLTLLGLGMFALSLAVADRLARALTRPITALATAAASLEQGQLSTRVHPGGPAEIAAVGSGLNRLAARIGDLLTAERETAADLSHRLRTPVTVLRLDAESLQDPVERDRLGADVDDLMRHIDAVITAARRPVREALYARCDAAAVVRSRTAFWSVLADEQQRRVQVDVPATPLPVRLHADDLAAGVDALLGNVFSHTPEGTPFAVRLTPRDGGGALLVIADDGPGLPGESVVLRGQSASGSTGLGIDIARVTAEASGGQMEINSGHGTGTSVALHLGPPAL